jgi:hypothetical protein
VGIIADAGQSVLEVNQEGELLGRSLKDLRERYVVDVGSNRLVARPA